MKTNFGKRASAAAGTIAVDAKQPPGEVAANSPGITGLPGRFDDIRDQVLARIEPAVAISLSREQLMQRVAAIVSEIATERRLLLNLAEQRTLAMDVVDDMVALGPIEPLLRDDTVSDILVNGPAQVFVERRGRLDRAAVCFRSDAHIMHVAQRIASAVGRRIDESSPMLDARLADGSRVNVVIPPLSLGGPCISIRKFARHAIDFEKLIAYGTVSPALTRALQIAAKCRLNVVISGGTGSGKTTLLNAMSRLIDPDERIITIEDAAELQLQQAHVVRLETRPANIEGRGQIAQRDLVRNALRMRPDRIIVGEVRGPEAFDMMQAMNTGHNGSMSTIHANSSRDALVRIENMVLMANLNLPSDAIRSQMASALDLLIHTERMRDGVRRVTELVSVEGIDGRGLGTADLATFRFQGEKEGVLFGAYGFSGRRPRFLPRLEYYGLAGAFMDALAENRETT